MKQKIVILLAAAFMLFQIPVLGAEIPEAAEGFYVGDFAGQIREEEAVQMREIGALLDSDTGAQIVLVTVDTTGEVPIDEYAYEMFEKWQIGDRSRNNGLLILMALDDEDYYTLQGEGIDTILTAEKIQSILDTHMEPDFDAGQYSLAAYKTYYAFASEFEVLGLDRFPDPYESLYVYDETGILTPETIQEIRTENHRVGKGGGSNFYVIALNSLNGENISDVIHRYFNEWELTAMDVMFLLSHQDEDYWILQGSEISQVLTEDMLNRLLEGFEPYFVSGDYNQGISSLSADLFAATKNVKSSGNTVEEKSTTRTEDTAKQDTAKQPAAKRPAGNYGWIIVGAIGGGLFFLGTRSNRRRRNPRPTYEDPMYDNHRRHAPPPPHPHHRPPRRYRMGRPTPPPPPRRQPPPEPRQQSSSFGSSASKASSSGGTGRKASTDKNASTFGTSGTRSGTSGGAGRKSSSGSSRSGGGGTASRSGGAGRKK